MHVPTHMHITIILATLSMQAHVPPCFFNNVLTFCCTALKKDFRPSCSACVDISKKTLSRLHVPHGMPVIIILCLVLMYRCYINDRSY